METTNKKSRTDNTGSSPCRLTSLPKPLLVEIVARVGSRSVVDLRNIKQCCRAFLKASEDNYVWQQVSLDKFPLAQWVPNEKALCFLKRCRESGNVESLYREGLLEFFKSPEGIINGLEQMKMAAAQGNMDAKYVYGMLLLCSSDEEFRKEVLEHMRFLRKSKCIIKCRTRVRRLLAHIWMRNGLVVCNPTPMCDSKNICKGWRLKKGVWSFSHDEHDDLTLCEYCRWDYELEFFYTLLNVR